MSLFVKSLGQWRLVHEMAEPGYPVTRTNNLPEGNSGKSWDHACKTWSPRSTFRYSVWDQKKGGAGFPTSAMQRQGQKEPHQLGQKQVHMEDKDNQFSKRII